MPTFVDSNVLAYAHDTSDQVRQSIASQLARRSLAIARGHAQPAGTDRVLCRRHPQVRPSLSPGDARALVDAYAVWPVVQVDPLLIVAASALEERHSFSFWDALIVEAARRGGAGRLVSEDLQHGRRIAGLVIENPFARNGS